MNRERLTSPSAVALGLAMSASGVMLLAVLAHAVGSRLTPALWAVIAVVSVGPLLAYAARRRRRRERRPARRGWIGWALVAAALVAVAVAVTVISTRDAQQAQGFLAFSVVPVGTTEVEFRVTSHGGAAERYVVPVGRGAFGDREAARLRVPGDGTVVGRLEVPARRGVVRLALRSGDAAGPIVRRLEVGLS